MFGGLGQLALQLGGDTHRDDDEAVGEEGGNEVTEWSVGDTWVGDGDSDCESVDSEMEDSLQHAGVYTAEEVGLKTLQHKPYHYSYLHILWDVVAKWLPVVLWDTNLQSPWMCAGYVYCAVILNGKKQIKYGNKYSIFL